MLYIFFFPVASKSSRFISFCHLYTDIVVLWHQTNANVHSFDNEYANDNTKNRKRKRISWVKWHTYLKTTKTATTTKSVLSLVDQNKKPSGLALKESDTQTHAHSYEYENPGMSMVDKFKKRRICLRGKNGYAREIANKKKTCTPNSIRRWKKRK